MVRGPLKIVRDESWLSTRTDASQAMFDGPGASRPSRLERLPLTVASVHDRLGLGVRSGI